MPCLRIARRMLSMALFAIAGSAGATGLQVAPTSLNLAASQNADGIWLSNTGNTSLHAQVRVYEWTQEAAADQLKPSHGLAISPPMLELAAGARQLVRVIRVGAPPVGSEAAYRIIVDELPIDEPASSPAPDATQAASASKGALTFVLRYSIPVFVAPGGDAAIAPKLSATLRRDEGKPTLEVGNSGSMHAQLGNLIFVDAAGKRRELVPGLLGYVLPGQTMRWPIDAPDGVLAQGGSLQSRINGEASERTLAPVDPAR
ncbi:MAG TPA: molecular chaperone [Dokdonella sp.]